MDNKSFKQRSLEAIKRTFPSTKKTSLWVVKVTVSVSFAIMILQYLQVVPWVSELLSPLFSVFGLPGEAALAYVSGYFVNVYSAIAAAVTLNLDIRSVTILSVMVLCSHNMIVETAVQKKTGSSAVRMVITRTISGIILGFVLNLILPQFGENPNVVAAVANDSSFGEMFVAWLKSTALLVPKMVLIIFTLNMAQALLAEFGIIRIISNMFRPVMRIFGLPARCSLLWIIANTVGLAYGAALMIEESRNGALEKEDIDRLNVHIGISHSNFEDLMLLASIGGIWWIMLISRWIMSIILVWEFRLESAIRNKFISL
ncbi:MAG: nucleoside recognition protein [Bacteroidales bacterium]|nr:nucleoside recognition protein [Bacteroidales bacterium]